MKPSDILGKKWGSEVDENTVRGLIDADRIDVLPAGAGAAHDLGFLHGRVRIFVSDHDRIVCLTHEQNDGRFFRMSIGTPVC